MSAAPWDAEVRALLPCRCHPAYKDRGMTDPQCSGCEYADDVLEIVSRAHRAGQQVGQRARGPSCETCGAVMVTETWVCRDCGPTP